MWASDPRAARLSFKCSFGEHDDCVHRLGEGGGFNPRRWRFELSVTLCECDCHSVCALAERHTVSASDWSKYCSCAAAQAWRNESTRTGVNPPSFSESLRSAREKQQRRREAVNAVRSRSGGKNRQEIRDLLIDEFNSRSLSVPPDSALEIFVDSIALPESPLGSIRMLPNAGVLLRGIAGQARGIIGIFKNMGTLKDSRGRDPYLVEPGRTPPAMDVMLDTGAEHVLDARSAPGQQSSGAHLVATSLELSSPAEHAPTVTVLVDMHRVGVLSAENSGALTQDLETAVRQGQTVMMLGLYGRSPVNGAPFLRIYPAGPPRA